MMPLINHYLYFGVNEWEFLSADDEVLASDNAQLSLDIQCVSFIC